jgi:anti-anti-sigma factor
MTVAVAEVSADNGSVCIRLGGEIDRANVSAVEGRIRAAVSGQRTAVSVDLASVSYLDSTGKQLLFDLALRLRESNIVLEIIVPFDSPTRRLIELSGLQSIAAVVLVHSDSSQIGPVELISPAQPCALKHIRHTLRRWLSEVGASPHIVDDVLIAVGEACTNVVDHAYGTEGGTMNVHLGLQGPDLVATIADTGQWGQPSAGNRGRGTLFMRHCSDDLRIDHGSTGTTVVIRRHLTEEKTR